MDFAREIAAICAVLGLLGTCLYALRRYQRPGPRDDGKLRATGKLRLSDNLVLHLVDCAGERCLVTEQRSGCVVILLPASVPVGVAVPTVESGCAAAATAGGQADAAGAC